MTVRIMDANATPLGIRHARDAATGLASLRRYFTEQFDAGRIRESDSALGRLMNHSENGALTGNDLFVIAVLLLVAGNETTRSEEHTSELQSLMRISYAVFCLKKKKKQSNE